MSLAGRNGPDAEGVEAGYAGQADAETDGSFRADVVVADGANGESGGVIGEREGLLKSCCRWTFVRCHFTDDDSSGKASPAGTAPPQGRRHSKRNQR